jgi:hypothetical protein
VDSTRNNLLEALKQVERRTENSASGWRLLLYAMVLIPVLAMIPISMWGINAEIFGSSNYVLPQWWHVFLASVGLTVFSIAFSRYHRERARSGLEASQLAAQLASGELSSNDPIFVQTPWPWRNLLPGREEGAKLARVLHRVAWNLDWYLQKPRRLWRWIWIYEPIAWLAFAALAGLMLTAGAVIVASLFVYGDAFWDQLAWELQLTPDRLKHEWYLWLLALAPLLPICFVHIRRQIWTEELVRHLRQRLLA